MAQLTIADDETRVQYTVGSSASTGPFAIPFEFFANSDIKVIITNTTTLADTVLAQHPSGFTITATAADDGFLKDGSLTLAVAVSDSLVTVYADYTLTKTTNFPLSGAFDIASLNTQFSRVFAALKQQSLTLSRNIAFSRSDSTTSFTIPADRADKVLSFDSSKNLQATISTADITTATTKAAEAAASSTAAAASATAASTSQAASATSATASAASATAAAASAASAAVTVASQAEAEAGTNNTNLMTPLRAKQAVDSYGVITSTDVGTSGANKILKLDGSGAVPALSGVNLTALNAANLGSGTVPTARLGSGTASSSTFLRGDSTYAEVGGAGLTLLGTGTASSSASLAFTSLMTSTYTVYLMVFEALLPATNGTIPYLYLSEDDGSSYTTSDMRYIAPSTFYGGSGSPSGNGGNTEASAANFWQLTGGALSNATNQGMSGHVWLFDTQNNSSLSRMHGKLVYSSDTTHNQIAANDVYGNTVSATDKDAIKVQMSSGNIASGKVKLYGVIAT